MMEALQEVETVAVIVRAKTLLIGRHHHVEGDIVELPETRAKVETDKGTCVYHDRVSSVVSGPDRASRVRLKTATVAPPRDASRFKGRTDKQS